MCFDLDSRPPITPIAGGALDGMPLMLTAADRNRFAAFRARAADPGGAVTITSIPPHLGSIRAVSLRHQEGVVCF